MKPGLYEQLVTRGLARRLERLAPGLEAKLRSVDPHEAPSVLGRYLAGALTRSLASLKESDTRVSLVNQLLTALVEAVHRGALDQDDLVEDQLRELLAIAEVSPVTGSRPPERPAIPLNTTDLLVNARGEHRIGAELLKEIQSADRIDLLCSFLKWSGFRLVRDRLQEFAERGGRLRVLTTCYLAATDARVLDELSRLGEVRVSYDTRRTRLHAKAWLFHRDTGFSTAYIGSSNLSSAALLDGLEWNVRLSQVESPRVLEKFQGTFDAYWEDVEFEPYDRSLFEARSQAERVSEDISPTYILMVRPYPFQAEILERLETEREVHGRWRNLVVAATGTGKTVMAALDYRRVQGRWGSANLLFVAHRDEILTQSLATFRAVLREGSFGDKWTGTSSPSQSQHLFASVQKLANVELETLPPEMFDVLIIDEFHHAAAPTYRRLLEHFNPRLLLGLTATPERADGQSVLEWFGGRSAAELRLWDALERGLLSPMQYFGVHDTVDLRHVPFRRGRYDQAELDRVYSGHEARAFLVLKQVREHVAEPSRMRALGFCAGVGHARFMADQFARAGFQATTVFGDTPRPDRHAAVAALRSGELQAIFTVDVFNEGVDIPEVDTVLLLRPTESATIFLQQLGRGLRLADGKECLTVLDFIGMARREFRFDNLYRALLGGTRKELAEQIEQGFPLLPSGCSMQLDRVATEIVLENVRAALRPSRARLRDELRALGPGVSLSVFLERTGAELNDIYRGSKPGWVQLQREVSPDDEPFLRAVSRMLHLDSRPQLAFLRRLLDGEPASSDLERRMSGMFDAALGDDWRGRPVVREELSALLPVLESRIDHLDHPLDEYPDVPLRVHCHYSLNEILAAFEVPHRVREGVYFHKPSGSDLFFITVRKSERDYSPTTLYRDYAVSPELFHWESQNSTREDSPTGQRYQRHRLGSTHALLFVRESSSDERGSNYTAPYLFLGPAGYVSHEGERPMAIIWKLKWPIPIQFYRGMRLAA